MEAFSLSKHNRISTKKLRRVTQAVDHLDYPTARGILSNLPQKGARIMEKTLMSAGANLLFKEPSSKEEDWVIKEIIVNQGPAFKRVRPRARGRADRVSRPTTHLKVVVAEKGE